MIAVEGGVELGELLQHRHHSRDQQGFQRCGGGGAFRQRLARRQDRPGLCGSEGGDVGDFGPGAGEVAGDGEAGGAEPHPFHRFGPAGGFLDVAPQDATPGSGSPNGGEIDALRRRQTAHQGQGVGSAGAFRGGIGLLEVADDGTGLGALWGGGGG